jgi:hypothetical protein
MYYVNILFIYYGLLLMTMDAVLAIIVDGGRTMCQKVG